MVIKIERPFYAVINGLRARAAYCGDSRVRLVRFGLSSLRFPLLDQTVYGNYMYGLYV